MDSIESVNNNPPPWITRFKARLLTGLAAASLVTLLVLSGLSWRADTWFYDAVAHVTSRPAGDSIVVVAIDEKSLAELGRWPWSRRTHAELINRLTASGVRGVGLDILLSDPALYDPEGDALLAQAMNRSGKVILPVYAEAENRNGPIVELMPIPEFAASAAALGHVDIGQDADGVARDAFLHAGVGSAHWPSLALALSQLEAPDATTASPPGLRNPEPEQVAPQSWVRDFEVQVPYADPPDGYQRVSYADVLKGRVAVSKLRGRWILVGATAPAIGKPLVVPGGHAAGTRLSAVDYQANVLNMLLRGDAIVPLALPAQLLLSILLVVAPLLLFGLRGLHKIWQPIAVAAALALLLSFLLLRFGHAWFPPMPALAVLGIGALLWLGHLLRRTRHQAQSDPLTGLPNRLRFDEELGQALRQAQRSGQPLSLLLLDVDHFRRLNDSLGQQAGDEVLRILSTILRGRARRPRDLVARLGSDQFAVLLPETTPQSAAAIATTIHVDLANLATRPTCPESTPPFTASIGIHTARVGEETTVEEIFQRADNALYQAKQDGRNRSFSHAGESGSITS
ncbi:MAG: CHASE2 domain-containing protein [Pseudoxanthomonas sp.]